MDILSPPTFVGLLWNEGWLLYVEGGWLLYLLACRLRPSWVGFSGVPSWPILVMLWCLRSTFWLWGEYLVEAAPELLHWAYMAETFWSFMLLVGVVSAGAVVHPASVSFRSGNRSGVLGALAGAVSIGVIAWAWSSAIAVPRLVE